MKLKQTEIQLKKEVGNFLIIINYGNNKSN